MILWIINLFNVQFLHNSFILIGKFSHYSFVFTRFIYSHKHFFTWFVFHIWFFSWFIFPQDSFISHYFFPKWFIYLTYNFYDSFIFTSNVSHHSLFTLVFKRFPYFHIILYIFVFFTCIFLEDWLIFTWDSLIWFTDFHLQSFQIFHIIQLSSCYFMSRLISHIIFFHVIHFSHYCFMIYLFSHDFFS